MQSTKQLGLNCAFCSYSARDDFLESVLTFKFSAPSTDSSTSLKKGLNQKRVWSVFYFTQEYLFPDIAAEGEDP